MSAYLVTAETINCCCAGWRLPYDRQIDDCAEFDDIGRRLWAMNAEAVGQRYEEEAEPPPFLFSYRPAKYSPAQILKCLECLRYQCSEGDIDQRPLYAELEQKMYRWAQHIANETAEYKAAQWGLEDPPARKLLAKSAAAAVAAAEF